LPARDTTDESQAAARQAEIARLHARGWSKVQIAAELGVDEKTVRHYVKRIHAEAAKLTANLAEAKQRELLMLEEAEREAWEAWERSKQDAVTETTRTLPEGDVQTEIRRQGQAGDSALLKRLIEISERRAKLLGMDAPTRSYQADVTPEQLEQMSDDELEQYIKQQQRAGARPR
jgi:DNA-binding CsgD family transcriptional regulator